ncbi:MAG TPA: hypothetical protein VL860_09375 [Planctomycetota bacterium]|nr:hypothetical protein [Planctomycetota bacterium]
MTSSTSAAPEIPVPGVSGYLPCPSGRSLFCVSHTASPSSGGRLRGTILLLQTCSEERKASHRTMVRLAGSLAAAGFTTHRVDLPGCGESTGTIGALRLADWLADATYAAVTLLPESSDAAPTWLGGLRLGAAVAGLCPLPSLSAGSTQPHHPPHWLAIAPVLEGRAWLRQLRTRRSIRSELTAPAAAAAIPAESAAAPNMPATSLGAEDFDGMLLSASMLADLEALNLATQLQRTSGIVIQAGPSKSVGREFHALNTPARTLKISAVRQEPFWERGEAVNDRPLIDALIAAVSQAL